MYNQNQELEKKNWNIIKESVQLELVLNILYYGISLFGTKRIGLLMERGLKGTAFGQVIYDIKNYINYFNPFNNNMSKNLISEENIIPLKNLIIEENIIPIKKMENIGNIEIISEEKLGIYNNYIAPYLTVENLIYLGTFVIISGITYYFLNFFINNVNNVNNVNIRNNEELQIEYDNLMFISKNIKNENSNLIKLINNLSQTDSYIKNCEVKDLTNISLINYLRQTYLNDYVNAFINDLKQLNLNFCIAVNTDEKLIEPVILGTVTYGQEVLQNSLKLLSSWVVGIVSGEVVSNHIMGEPTPSEPVLENIVNIDNIKLEDILNNSGITIDEFANLSADEQESILLAYQNSLNENNIIKDTGPIIFERVDEYGLPLDMEDSVREEWLKVFDELGVSNVQEYEEYLTKTQEVVEVINEEKKSIFSELVNVYKEILKNKK